MRNHLTSPRVFPAMVALTIHVLLPTKVLSTLLYSQTGPFRPYRGIPP